MSAHTPGPWEVSRHAASHVVAEGERGICTTGGYQTNAVDSGDLLAENQANAARIVECVNAMEGIEDPARFVAVAKEAIAQVSDALVSEYDEKFGGGA